MVNIRKRANPFIIAIMGLALALWWLWWAPAVADALWVEPLVIRIAGSAVIASFVGLVFLFKSRVRSLLALIFKPRVLLVIFGVSVVAYLAIHWEDLPFWMDELAMKIEPGLWWIEDFILDTLWGETSPFILIAILATLGGVGFVIYQMGIQNVVTLAKSVPLLLLIRGFEAWWKMYPVYRLSTAVCSLALIAMVISGQQLSAAILVFCLVTLTWRGWPRINPLDPRPTEPFQLPVLRLLGFPDYLVLSLGCLGILTMGLIGAWSTGQLWCALLGVASSQVFFAWYVDKRPTTTTAWTSVTINPTYDRGITIDRSKGPSGEISFAPLSIGAIRLKEKKGIFDNLLRLFGYSFFEFEPVGVRPEPGEIETFELYIFTSHLRMPIKHPVLKHVSGGRALIKFVASLGS